jgi:repressor LexA
MTPTLTTRQQQVLNFIRKTQEQKGHSPTLREIAVNFDMNVTAAADHVRALTRKGAVKSEPRRARSLVLITPYDDLRGRVMDIPVFGSIPAGFPRAHEQDPEACISVDAQTLGIKASTRVFALKVKGDSMIGKHILNNDLVILDAGAAPKNGDVVAALIDGESTLKTFAMERGKPVLRAENPKYPKLIPAADLTIQGVMAGLIRPRSG